MIKRIFSVDGMACPHCKKRVEDALTALPGVESAVADIDSKQVEVCFDETRVTPQQLQEAVDGTLEQVSKKSDCIFDQNVS